MMVGWLAERKGCRPVSVVEVVVVVVVVVLVVVVVAVSVGPDGAPFGNRDQTGSCVGEAAWSRQLGRDSRLGRERFGVSGTPWFLCESKTTAQLRWGPDGARIVAHLVRAPWQGVAVHGWAPKSKAGNASKAPGSVQKPPVGFDVRVVGRGSSGNLWREHRRCLGFGGGGFKPVEGGRQA